MASLRLEAALLALALLAGGSAFADDRKGPTAAGRGHGPRDEEERFINERYEPEFRRRVTETIDRGVRWVQSRQQPDGSWACGYNKNYPMGPTALAVLTLLKGGVPAKHPSVRSAFRHLRTLPMAKTYSVGILLMALDAKYAAARDPFSVQKVDRYGRSVRKDPCLEHIDKQDLLWMRKGVAFLLEQQTGRGVWRYPSKQAFDLSNTQYALLGLKAAMRCGIKIPTQVWLDALKILLDWQEPTGKKVPYKGNEVRGRYRIQWTEEAQARGFRYAKETQPITGSMTTAGLSSLIICQGELWKSRKFKGKLRRRTRRGIRDAMTWVQTYFDVVQNPIQPEEGRKLPEFGAGNDYYYLYGLERASLLGRIRFYGEDDWYEDGAELLMHDQHEDGHWPRSPPLVESCFAILFLKRATAGMANPVITPAPGKPPADTRSKREGER